MTESKSGTEMNSTSYTYNENGAAGDGTHHDQYSSYTYDVRDLVTR